MKSCTGQTFDLLSHDSLHGISALMNMSSDRFFFNFLATFRRASCEATRRMGSSLIRTVLSKYKCFCARGLDQAEKVDLCKRYWIPQRKIGIGKHFFEIISLEYQQKKLTSAFFAKKEEQDIRLYIPKSKQIYKDLKTPRQMVPWKPFLVYF